MKKLCTLTGVLICATLSAGVGSALSSESIIASFPDELKVLYNNTATTVVEPNMSKFTPPEKPWKWCHSESYQGNPWRVALTNEIKRLVDGLIADGVVSSFEMSDSNGDASIQISHIRSFIEKECSVITSVPGSPTGLNAAVEAAAEAGIPFVTGAATVTSPAAFNADANYYQWGFDMAKSLSESLGGKGNVVMVEGIAGVSIVNDQRKGAQAAFAEYPDIKVVRMVNGNWSPADTKSVILQTLATNPAPIDGVWTTGSETRVVTEAFKEAGRPIPVVTGSVTGDALGYWKADNEAIKFTGGAVLPKDIGQAVFRLAGRILAGQQPKLNTIMTPIPVVTMADFPSWYGDCMKPDSSAIFPVSPTDPIPSEVMKAFFDDATPAPGWDYSTVPGACD